MAFGKCRHLVCVIFGEHSNITNLGANAFKSCSALKSITLPDKLKVIERLVFTHCSALERIVCNKHLETIGEAAFQACSNLKFITLPDKLKVIEEKLFAGCTSLERVVCNKNLKTIGDGAFFLCSMLEDVQLASSSMFFGTTPFNLCDRLIELAAAAGFPSVLATCKGVPFNP